MESFLPVRGTDVRHHGGGGCADGLTGGQKYSPEPRYFSPSLAELLLRKEAILWLSPKGGWLFFPLPVPDECLEDKFGPQQGRGTGVEVLGRRVLTAMQGFLGKGGFLLHGAATVWSAVVITGSHVLF